MPSGLAKIPATIITGFLGAGKTTIIRRISRARRRGGAGSCRPSASERGGALAGCSGHDRTLYT
ncbi:MAG: GTP-binding protein [Methyloligellaceae bacterium]